MFRYVPPPAFTIEWAMHGTAHKEAGRWTFRVPNDAKKWYLLCTVPAHQAAPFACLRGLAGPDITWEEVHAVLDTYLAPPRISAPDLPSPEQQELWLPLHIVAPSVLGSPTLTVVGNNEQCRGEDFTLVSQHLKGSEPGSIPGRVVVEGGVVSEGD
jgi:hypothetical protein